MQIDRKIDVAAYKDGKLEDLILEKMDADLGEDENEAASDMVLEVVTDDGGDSTGELEANPDTIPAEGFGGDEGERKSLVSRKTIAYGSDVRSMSHYSACGSRTARSQCRMTKLGGNKVAT